MYAVGKCEWGPDAPSQALASTVTRLCRRSILASRRLMCSGHDKLFVGAKVSGANVKECGKWQEHR